MNRGVGFLATILRRRRLVIGAAVLLMLTGLCVGLAARFDWQAAELEAAEQALRQHDCADARSRLNRYLARWPGDPKALLMATRAAWQTGAHAEAERFLSACEAAGGQTDTSRLEWAMLGAHQGDFGGEESGLRALVERGHSEAPAILEALARGYQLARRFPEAMQALNALINYGSVHADLLVQRGTILRRIRGPHGMEPGEQDLRRAVALAPESATAHAALAGVLSDLGYVQEEIFHYEEALRCRPADPATLLGLARAFTDSAQLAEAKRHLDELLAVQPGHADGLVERGRLALRQGRAAEAAEFLARAVRAAPWHRAGHRLYLSALNELGQSEAAAQCEACLTVLMSEDAEGGRLQMRLQGAFQDPGRHWDLYQWFVHNGREEDAFAGLLELLRHAPRHGPAHRVLAVHFDREDQPRRAAQHRALALGTP